MQASLNHVIEGTTQGTNYVSQKAKEWLEEAQKPGTKQRVTQAAVRSLVGIIAISQYPYTAALGAAASVLKPDMVKQVCSLSEGAITGIWNRMSFNQKLLIASTGVISALYFDPTVVFSTLGAGFAFKLGAELGLKNLSKEEIAEKYREIAEKYEES